MTAITSQIGRVVRRGEVVEQRDHPDRHRDEPGQRQRPVRRDVQIDHEERGSEEDERQATPGERQDREPEERGDHADRAERAGDHDPGVEELEAQPGKAGEEEQRDDVRVDQRREEPRQEAFVHVDDGCVCRVQREVTRHGQRGRRSSSAGQAASGRGRRSRSCAVLRPPSGWTPCAPRRPPTPRCGRATSRGPAAMLQRRSRPSASGRCRCSSHCR